MESLIPWIGVLSSLLVGAVGYGMLRQSVNGMQKEVDSKASGESVQNLRADVDDLCNRVNNNNDKHWSSMEKLSEKLNALTITIAEIGKDVKRILKHEELEEE